MYSFPNLEPVCCSISGSNSCFLTCIQVSQEAGKVVWYSHLFKNFPWFVVIHTVKGFSIVNKAEVNVFLEFPCFFCDPMDVDNLMSGSSASSKSSLYIWNFSVPVLVWRTLSITLLAYEMSASVVVWTFFGCIYLFLFFLDVTNTDYSTFLTIPLSPSLDPLTSSLWLLSNVKRTMTLNHVSIWIISRFTSNPNFPLCSLF